MTNFVDILNDFAEDVKKLTKEIEKIKAQADAFRDLSFEKEIWEEKKNDLIKNYLGEI